MCQEHIQFFYVIQPQVLFFFFQMFQVQITIKDKRSPLGYWWPFLLKGTSNTLAPKAEKNFPLSLESLCHFFPWNLRLLLEIYPHLLTFRCLFVIQNIFKGTIPVKVSVLKTTRDGARTSKWNGLNLED